MFVDFVMQKLFTDMKQKTVYERSHKNGPLPLRQSPSWQGWGWVGGRGVNPAQ